MLLKATLSAWNEINVNLSCYGKSVFVVAVRLGAWIWESCRQNSWIPVLLLLPAPGGFQAEVEGRDESEKRRVAGSGEREVSVLRQLMGPSSRGQCSPGRGSWSFGVKLGLGGCLGWNCWKLWNASESQSPLRQSPSPGHHFLGPCLRRTKSPLMGRAWAAAWHCSFLQRIPSLMRCHSVRMTLLTGHC